MKRVLLILLTVLCLGCIPNATSQPVFADEVTLREAIEAGNSDELRTLLAGGADPNKTLIVHDEGNAFSTSPLYLAVLTGVSQNVELLLEHGAKPDTLTDVIIGDNNSQLTPIFAAVLFDYPEIVALLIKYNANIDMVVSGDTPLSLAVKDDNQVIAELLVQKGATIRDELAFACINENLEMFTYLLEHGADANLVYEGKNTFECSESYYFTKELLEHGAHPDIYISIEAGLAFDENDWPIFEPKSNLPILSYYVIKNDITMVELFLEHGANPNIKQESGETPLMYAIGRLFIYGEKERPMVELLLKHGADMSYAKQMYDSLL